MTPADYARRLAGYITNPSTIRVRTLEMYGTAPTVAAIAKMRAKVEADKAKALEDSYRLSAVKSERGFKCGHPVTSENTYIKDNGTAGCRTCRRELQAKASKKYRDGKKAEKAEQAKPEWQAPAEIRLWPSWYRAEPKRVPVRSLARAAANRIGVAVDEILGEGRAINLVCARAAVAKVSIERGAAYAHIGRVMGGRDHSSIIHLVKTYPHKCKTPEKYADIVSHLRTVTA